MASPRRHGRLARPELTTPAESRIALRVIPVHPDEPRKDRLADAAACLERGGVIALPTETFYGLAADALSAAALDALNRIKHKPEGSPILLLLADAGQVLQLVDRVPGSFQVLVERFWPGPLTLVIPAADDLPTQISGGRGTVAVRVPGLALPRRLAARLGRPISGVSANRFGGPPCRTAAEVASSLGEGLELILDGGPAPGGRASTLLDLCGARPRILREGQVPVSSLSPFLPDLELSL